MHYRKLLAIAFAIALCPCMFGKVIRAQSPPTPTYLLHPVRDGVYWIEGGDGSNNGFIVGDHGVIAIDTKTTVASEKLTLAEFAKVTNKPITHVIITHADTDHANGLPALPSAGLTIIAQENCMKFLEAVSAKGGPSALPKEYIPNKTVDKKEAMTIDGVRIELYHWAPAHTGGDLVVYLPDQKIAFTGDSYNSRLPVPNIHMNAGRGGSAVGWNEQMKGMISLNADLYVNGHGGVSTKPELEMSLKITEKELAQIKLLIAQGQSYDEIQKALGEDKNKPPQHQDGRTLPFYSEYVYQELAKK
jgi:glyoxylase-like metal-dependent hydrolase (beta-lactamase superfamily II)